MSATTAIPTPANLAATAGASVLPWISRGMEGLWLIAVFLVPLMFLGQDYAISEAQIAYVEVPKVALLRTLAGLIVLLWSLEWAIKSRAFQGSFSSISINTLAKKLRPSKVLLNLINWLKGHPTRWLMLSAVLYFGSTFLSTLLSGSRSTSIWGEIPGQDGYSAYTIASYGVLFAVIANHLKSKAQLGRLIGAVVLMGILVGLYGILQHYGHDFFSITESTGGGTSRVTIFMGNTIFAGAVLSMTVPLTLVVAAMNFHNEDWGNWGPLSRIGQLGRDTVFTYLWALILAVQLLGLMFTFSRGPWSGAVLALVAFLGLVVLSLGWRMLIRTGLALGLAGVFSASFLHWQGNVSIVNVGPWLGLLLALLGLAGTIAVLFSIKKFGRAIVLIAAAGIAVAIVGASVLAPSALSDRGGVDATAASLGIVSTTGRVSERILSIKTDVVGGFIGGRSTHWKVSWKLIKDRPWFGFDELSLSWLRPLIGYGPDLFRYTYLLESPAEVVGFRPLEPDHAHNFFIHQTVEQGLFGGFASLALFASVFGVVGHHLLRRQITGNPVYRLLLIGLMAIIFGRFLEMMVGVARISDLTVLWVIFGLFAAMVRFDDEHQDAVFSDASQSPQSRGRRNRRRAARASAARSFSTGLMFRLAIVAWLVGGIGVVTWQKSINSVRASVAEGRALEHFRKGDLENSVKDLDKAIKLAPGVPSYYNNRAQVFLVYQLQPESFTEPGCDQQVEVPYLVCLGVQSLESNLESVNKQPFNFRASLAAGNSAFNLRLHESARDNYTNAAGMVPDSFGIRNDLAESQIDTGFYDEALAELDWSLGITGDSSESARALYLKGRVLQELGRPDEAVESLKHGLSLDYASGSEQASLDLIRDINTEQGFSLDIDYFDRLINQNSRDAVSYYLRGLAHLALGNEESALLDIQESYALGLRLDEVLANRGYARLKIRSEDARAELAAAVDSSPQNALFNAYISEYYMSSGNYAEAFNYLEKVTILDPDLGLGNLIRARTFMALGMQEFAKGGLDSTVAVDFPNAQDYVDRGELYASLGEYESAFSDFNEAIRINPNRAKYYNARAKGYAIMGDFETALADFDVAIQIDPAIVEYLLNRGVLHNILGDTKRSLADFGIAQSLGISVGLIPDERDKSYFSVYPDNTSLSVPARQFLRLQIEGPVQRDIEYYSAMDPDSSTYQSSLQPFGQAYLASEMWMAAIDIFSRLIELSPNTPGAYRNRGDAYLALRNYQRAIDDYEQAVNLDSLSSVNLVARGRGYAEIGEYELARNDFGEAIRLDPDSSDAYAARGYLSVQMGNHSMSFSDIDHAIAISPSNHDAYFKRANVHIGLDQTVLALKNLENAINLAPTNTDYLFSRGLLSYESGDYDSALGDFSAAIPSMEGSAPVDPRHARTIVYRAKTYLQIADREKARNDADMAVRILELILSKSEWVGHHPAVEIQLADAHRLFGDR